MIIIDRKNKSSTYFLPLFDSFFKIKHFNLLKNTYLFFEDIVEDTFSLLYEFDGKIYGKYRNRTGFTIYEQDIRSSEYYLFEEDFDNYVLYTFKIPDELIEIKHLLIEGKYSKLSDTHKEKIILFMHEKYSLNVAKKIHQILYKSTQLREMLEKEIKHAIHKDAELSSVMDISEEIFINNLKEVKLEKKDGFKKLYGISSED